MGRGNWCGQLSLVGLVSGRLQSGIRGVIPMLVLSAGFNHRWEELPQRNHRTFQTLGYQLVLQGTS